MVVDILVVEKGWWPVAWGIRFIGHDNQKVLVIRESPYNPHARGRKEKEYVEGGWVEVYENQVCYIWTLKKLEEFLQSLEPEEELEIAISEDVSINLPLPDVRWWRTRYTIYM
jgi:hypothetical protein